MQAFALLRVVLPKIVISIDKNAAYPLVIEELKAESTLPQSSELRQSK